MESIPHTIRLASADDASTIAAIYAPFVESTVVSFEELPPDAATMRERMVATLERYPWVVAETNGDLHGYAYASPYRARPAYRWSVEVSVYTDDRYRRRGAASALYTMLFEILAKQGFHRAFAGISLPNPGSVAFHTSFGFEPVGTYRRAGRKFGRWVDVAWWQRDVSLDAVPDEPRTVAEVLQWSGSAKS